MFTEDTEGHCLGIVRRRDRQQLASVRIPYLALLGKSSASTQHITKGVGATKRLSSKVLE